MNLCHWGLSREIYSCNSKADFTGACPACRNEVEIYPPLEDPDPRDRSEVKIYPPLEDPDPRDRSEVEIYPPLEDPALRDPVKFFMSISL